MKHKIPWTVTMPLITSYLILLLMSRKVEDNFSSLWSSWSIPQKKEVFVRWCLDCITTTLYFCFSGWSLCEIRRSQSHKFLLWLVQETWQTPTNHRPAVFRGHALGGVAVPPESTHIHMPYCHIYTHLYALCCWEHVVKFVKPDEKRQTSLDMLVFPSGRREASRCCSICLPLWHATCDKMSNSKRAPISHFVSDSPHLSGKAIIGLLYHR